MLLENIYTEESAGEYFTAVNTKVVDANNAKKGIFSATANVSIWGENAHDCMWKVEHAKPAAKVLLWLV